MRFEPAKYHALTSSLPGLDWSEDSADDDDEEETETFFPFQSSWRPQNGSVFYVLTPQCKL